MYLVKKNQYLGGVCSIHWLHARWKNLRGYFGYLYSYRLFYRAMHFSAKRGIAIVYCLSVCLYVRPSVTIRYHDHIGWNSSKIISRPNSLGLPPVWGLGWPQHGPSGATRTPPKLGRNRGGVTRERKKPAISPKRCKIGPSLLLLTITD